MSALHRGGDNSLCLSLFGSAAKKAKEKLGIYAAHILRLGLNGGRRGATLRSPRRIRGNWRELGAEFGTGVKTGPASSVLGLGKARGG